MPIDALSVLCAQLTRDMLAIAKFLFYDSQCIRNKCNTKMSWQNATHEGTTPSVTKTGELNTLKQIVTRNVFM